MVEDTYTIDVTYDNGRDTPVTVQATLIVHEVGWVPSLGLERLLAATMGPVIGKPTKSPFIRHPST